MYHLPVLDAATLTTGILTAADQSGQQNVIYAPTYSTQVNGFNV